MHSDEEVDLKLNSSGTGKTEATIPLYYYLSSFLMFLYDTLLTEPLPWAVMAILATVLNMLATDYPCCNFRKMSSYLRNKDLSSRTRKSVLESPSSSPSSSNKSFRVRIRLQLLQPLE